MLLKILAFAATLAAAVLAALVHWRLPLGFDLFGAAFYITQPAEVIALWAVVMIGILLASKLVDREPLAPIWGGLALGALLVGGWLVLRQPSAERIDLAQADASARSTRKTLVIGIDGMTWTRTAPLVREGRLPNIAALMRDGSYGALESYRSHRDSVDQDGYWSPVVWTTIATGVGAERHGVTDFTIVGKDGKTLPAQTWHRRVPAFWNIFTAFARSSGIVGWWATWPAEEIDGILVSSGLGLRGHRGIRGIQLDDKAWFRKRRKLTWPEAYKHVVAEEIGLPGDIDGFINERIFPFEKYMVRDSSDLDTIRSVLWQDRLYLDVTLHLLENEDFSVYATYLEGIDVLSHQFWEFMAYPDSLQSQARFSLPEGFDDHTRVVDRYYEVIDEYVGQLVEAAGPETTIIICADHGFATDPDHPRKADHERMGVIIARGEGIRPTNRTNLSLRGSVASLLRGQVSVLDILPTLLYLHDLPVADELEGDVLYRMIEPSYADQHPLIAVDTYGDFQRSRRVEIDTADEDEYMDRLRSLGYVD
jgi:predicted AlkP superfamily phosphohydrolase/phosphomutase